MLSGFAAYRYGRKSILLPILVLILAAVFQPVHPVKADTIVVNTLTDENDGSCSDGDCSLRDAIATASSGDEITFSVTGTITLTLGDIQIIENMTINGPGETDLTIDGNASDRIFSTSDSLTDLTIYGLTFTNGLQGEGGAFRNSGVATLNHCTFIENNGDYGGAIFNSGTLTINYSTIHLNDSTMRGGGIQNRGTDAELTIYSSVITDNDTLYFGGGIFNEWGTLTIIRSTLSGNSSNTGGGLANIDGSVTISTSTISGNIGNYRGGGVYNTDGSMNLIGTTTINYSTITNNTAEDGGGGIYNTQDPGGIAQVNFQSTVVAGNIQTTGSGNEDCQNYLGSFISQDYNLTGIGTGCSLGGAHDQTTAAPKLYPLGDYGGFTPTHRLMPGSPALDQIPIGANSCGTAYIEDQRGVARPVGIGCDIGAFEVQIDPANVGFYVPSKYRWYLKTDQSDGWSWVISFGWGGGPELQPVMGDWNGDGVDTAGFYKPSQWKWFLKNDFADGWAGVSSFQWGGDAEMIPIAGDWDGDGDDTVGFYKPSASEWYLKEDNTSGWTGFIKVVWGGADGNIPIAGDWDGDGVDTIGFFVPSANRWWLKNDLADGWAGVSGFTFGTTDPMDPVVGDWDGDGVDTVGGYVASKWRWFLKDDQVSGWSNVSNLKFGVTAGYEVIAGDWE